ncbi:hypothetical protein BH20ACT7_BH20ACT7_20870 [soil metagenome]
MALALHRLTQWIGQRPALDKVGDALMWVLGPTFNSRLVKNAANGTWLGHPLHPLLVTLPIGTWAGTGLLDLLGEDNEQAADTLLTTGVISALPTAMAGLAQWVDTYGPPRRIGAAHAMANNTALALQLASVVARRQGRRGLGKGLSFAALGLVSGAGYLGGHLSYALGVGVDHTAFHDPLEDWTSTDLAAAAVPDHAPVTAQAGERQIMLARHDGEIVAYDAVCTHAGGPLGDGTIVDGCVRCPWHGSMFSLADGSVVEAPATTPQPRYDVRLSGGLVEVRAALPA